jgi:hypothetical protein
MRIDFVFGNTLLPELGLTRKTKSIGLTDLEEIGLIALGRRKGPQKTHLVTVLRIEE